MEICKLKADPNLPHHYFITVAIKTMNEKNPGEMYLKYRPIYIHHTQIEKLRDAVMLSKDKIFSTTSSEATKIFEVTDITNTFCSLKMAAKANQCSLHHFSSEYKIDEEWFNLFVEQANIIKSIKEQLQNARIHY